MCNRIIFLYCSSVSPTLSPLLSYPLLLLFHTYTQTAGLNSGVQPSQPNTGHTLLMFATITPAEGLYRHCSSSCLKCIIREQKFLHKCTITNSAVVKNNEEWQLQALPSIMKALRPFLLPLK